MEITRCHLGRFGRNLGEILPTILPVLPILLRDLRNEQNLFNTYFLVFTTFNLVFLFPLCSFNGTAGLF